MLAACGTAAKSKEVVVIVKGDTDGWWERFGVGVADAGTEFGVTASMIGPSDADGGDNNAAQQVELIDQLIAKKVAAIVVVPIKNDDAMNAALARARTAGIVVLSHEGADQRNTDWDVEVVDKQEFGLAPIKKLIAESGAKGEYGLFVGGAGGHDDWAHIAVGYQKAIAPNMTLVSLPIGDSKVTGNTNARMVAGSTVAGVVATVCGENECGPTKTDCQCAKATAALLATHPNLKGIVGFGSQAPIGAGIALKAASNTGVTVVGAALPGQAKDLLLSGHITEAFLWDPADSGYAVVAVANKILGGDKSLSGGVTFPRLGAANVDDQNKDIIFNKIQSITKDNVTSLAATWGL